MKVLKTPIYTCRRCWWIVVPVSVPVLVPTVPEDSSPWCLGSCHQGLRHGPVKRCIRGIGWGRRSRSGGGGGAGGWFISSNVKSGALWEYAGVCYRGIVCRHLTNRGSCQEDRNARSKLDDTPRSTRTTVRPSKVNLYRFLSFQHTSAAPYVHNVKSSSTTDKDICIRYY